MSSTRCAVISCETPSQPNQIMCKGHWFQLPQGIRMRIWKYYRSGDRAEYFKAFLEAVRFFQESKPLVLDDTPVEPEKSAEPDFCTYCGSKLVSYMGSSNLNALDYRLSCRCTNCSRSFSITRSIQNWPPVRPDKSKGVKIRIPKRKRN